MRDNVSGTCRQRRQPQQPVEESQAEVLASMGSETSATHLLDDAMVGAKLSHIPSHYGGKVLKGFLSDLTYSNQANILKHAE